VIDDILGLIILSSFRRSVGEAFSYAGLARTAAGRCCLPFLWLVGSRVINRLAPLIQRLHLGKPFFNLGLILCLGLSVASIYVGVAAIIGAFLAGMALAEATEENHKMHQLTTGVTEFLVPFFLVNIGMQLGLAVFREVSMVMFAVVLTLIAVVTKFVGCGLGAWGMKRREMAQVGVGMVRGRGRHRRRQIGLGLGMIGQQFFAAVFLWRSHAPDRPAAHSVSLHRGHGQRRHP
jgi:Kef-type K+ transport system membrane component KefB